VRQRAAEIGCIGELAGLALGERDELGQRAHADRIAGDDRKRLLADQADRYEVALDAERQVLVRDRQHHQRPRGRHAERVAGALPGPASAGMGHHRRAPGGLRISTCGPKSCDSRSVTMRAITSGALPAAVAMTTFTGRDGQLWAWAVATDIAAATIEIAIPHQ